MPKLEDKNLSIPFVQEWVHHQPVLKYNPSALKQFRNHPVWLADRLEETLLHLLLGHPHQRSVFKNAWAFDVAADLEVWQYHSRVEDEESFASIFRRLHLPASFTVKQAYAKILNLERAYGIKQNLPKLKTVPISRQEHFYWPGNQPLIDSSFDAWRAGLRQIIPSHKPDAQSRFFMLYNQLLNPELRAKISWRRLLRRFVLSGRRNLSQSSLRRPSKRYHTFPGTRRVRKVEIAVVIDTSGSVSSELRQQFFLELRQLWQQVHSVQIIEADYQVRKTYPFDGHTPEFSAGGGATDFEPALVYINMQRHFDAVIYLTDGEAAYPQVECRFPLLWLISNDHHKSETKNWPDFVVYMEDSEQLG